MANALDREKSRAAALAVEVEDLSKTVENLRAALRWSAVRVQVYDEKVAQVIRDFADGRFSVLH